MGSAHTRGRIAGETQAAAITRVVGLLPQRKAILEALDRVAGSAAFQSSKRGQSFLRYVVEHALAGELDQLKERCIGSTLFGRPPDYDTGSDSIVRVTANEVRKRLANFYAQEAREDPVSFDLPVGSYIPEIQMQRMDQLERMDRLEKMDRHPVAVAAEVPRRPEPHGFHWRAIAIAGWCFALVVGLLWARGTLTKSASAQARALRVLPWTALFEGGTTPRLIMADSAMGTLRVFDAFPASMEDYANRRFLSPPSGLRPEFLDPWNQIATRRLTSVADARIAAEYAPLAVQAGRIPVIRSARDFSLSDFRHGDNLILLGSDRSNPWVELFHDQMDFLLRPGSGRATKVEIRHPHPGDPAALATNVASGASGEAYATLSLVNGLDGRGRVLIVQGTNMEGTDLAGELALNPEGMAGALRHCGIDAANPAGRFEILLRLNTTAGSASASAVLATHCSSGK